MKSIMLVPPVNVSLQTCFSMLCLNIPLHKCNIAWSISLRNSGQPTTMTTGCEILLGVVLYLARSWYISQEIGLAQNLHAFWQAVCSIFLILIEAVFMSWATKSQKGLCHGPAGGLQTPAPFCSTSIFHAHNLGTFDANNINFFFLY